MCKILTIDSARKGPQFTVGLAGTAMMFTGLSLTSSQAKDEIFEAAGEPPARTPGKKAGSHLREQLDTYLTGTLAGAGSFRCGQCGFAVGLSALEEMPKCPSCGNTRFARASLFDTHGLDEPPTLGEEGSDWIDALRDGLTEKGQYLVYRDEEHISVMPLLSEWVRIGRSLTADIRFDDPTVSRRHAIIAHQGDRVRVLDDRSLNGVFRNGERVEWAELEDGDELIVGRYRLHFIESQGARAGLGAVSGRAAA